MALINGSLGFNFPFTPLSNIFINTYMTKAHPTYSIIYIFILNKIIENENLDSKEISENLNVLESDLFNALKYWENQNLIKVEKTEYLNITFIDPSNLQENKLSEKNTTKKISKSNILTEKQIQINESVFDNLKSKENSDEKEFENNINPIENISTQKNNLSVVDTDTYKNLSIASVNHDRDIPYIGSKPSYSPQEIEVYKSQSKPIKNIFKTAEKTLGKLLTTTDLSVIFSFYDWLRLPPEVIELLFVYCTENGHRRMSYIEKVAVDWAENNINTVEKANEHLNRYNKIYSKILRRLGHSGRLANDVEMKFMDKWLDELNFPLDIVLIACDKTILNTGNSSFSYTESILVNWHKNNIKTKEEISEFDSDFQKSKEFKTTSGNKNYTTPIKKNSFTNYTGRTWDYDEIARLEREYIKNQVKGC